MRTILEEVYQDYFEEVRFWLVDTEANEDGERTLKLVDLQAVAAMSERNFIRRVASLRTAWRLHLKSPARRKERRDHLDDRQDDLFPEG